MEGISARINMPIFETIVNSIVDAAEQAGEEGTSLKARCPQCGRLVMKKELEKKGCYLCGWTPGDETAKSEAQERKRPYRARCTRCGAINVTKQLLEKGCYVCGLKPIALGSDFGPTREERERLRREHAERELEFEL